MKFRAGGGLAGAGCEGVRVMRANGDEYAYGQDEGQGFVYRYYELRRQDALETKYFNEKKCPEGTTLWVAGSGSRDSTTRALGVCMNPTLERAEKILFVHPRAYCSVTLADVPTPGTEARTGKCVHVDLTSMDRDGGSAYEMKCGLPEEISLKGSVYLNDAP